MATLGSLLSSSRKRPMGTTPSDASKRARSLPQQLEVWEVKDGSGWRSIDPACTSTLSDAYAAGLTSCLLTRDGVEYEVDLTSAQQRNRRSGTVRDIRLVQVVHPGASTGAAAPPGGSGGTWEFRENELWQAMDSVAAAALALGRASTSATWTFARARAQYEVEWSTMVQTNVATGFKRDIREVRVMLGDRPASAIPSGTSVGAGAGAGAKECIRVSSSGEN